MKSINSIPTQNTKMDQASTGGRRRAITLTVLSCAMLGFGVFGTWTVLKNAPAQVEITQNEGQTQTVNRLEEAVTRALSSQEQYDLAMLTQEDSIAKQAACLEHLNGLVAASERDNSPVSEADQLNLARSIAQGSVGCNTVSITVEGHSAQSTDEIENLRVSWQEAENTIMTLAQEGLDVSRFRALGFGSRALNGQAGTAAPHVSFQIRVDS